MRRTTLRIDETLLSEAVRLSGSSTNSEVVARALKDFGRRFKAGQILELAGSGLWQGDLGEMRGDPPARNSRRRRPR